MTRILALVLMLCASSAVASECSNASVTKQLLPPVSYQHEPTLPYMTMSAQLLNTLRGTHKGQVVGYYFPTSGKIAVCAGLTGRALRIVRMHEEAHKDGWRH